jgi:hypothetical protein
MSTIDDSNTVTIARAAGYSEPGTVSICAVSKYFSSDLNVNINRVSHLACYIYHPACDSPGSTTSIKLLNVPFLRLKGLAPNNTITGQTGQSYMFDIPNSYFDFCNNDVAYIQTKIFYAGFTDSLGIYYPPCQSAMSNTIQIFNSPSELSIQYAFIDTSSIVHMFTDVPDVSSTTFNTYITATTPDGQTSFINNEYPLNYTIYTSVDDLSYAEIQFQISYNDASLNATIQTQNVYGSTSNLTNTFAVSEVDTPYPPSNVILDGNSNDRSATISWTPSIFQDYIPIIGYYIYKRHDSDEFLDSDIIATVSSDIRSYYDSNLEVGQENYYAVQAHSVSGRSTIVRSDPNSFVVNSALSPIDGSGGVIANYLTTHNPAISISWMSASPPNDVTILSYNIELLINGNPSGTTVVEADPSSNTYNYLKTGVNINTAYTFLVSSNGENDTQSSNLTIGPFTPALIDDVTDVSVNAIVSGLEVSWNTPNNAILESGSTITEGSYLDSYTLKLYNCDTSAVVHEVTLDNTDVSYNFNISENGSYDVLITANGLQETYSNVLSDCVTVCTPASAPVDLYAVGQYNPLGEYNSITVSFKNSLNTGGGTPQYYIVKLTGNNKPNNPITTEVPYNPDMSGNYFVPFGPSYEYGNTYSCTVYLVTICYNDDVDGDSATYSPIYITGRPIFDPSSITISNNKVTGTVYGNLAVYNGETIALPYHDITSLVIIPVLDCDCSNILIYPDIPPVQYVNTYNLNSSYSNTGYNEVNGNEYTFEVTVYDSCGNPVEIPISSAIALASNINGISDATTTNL